LAYSETMDFVDKSGKREPRFFSFNVYKRLLFFLKNKSAFLTFLLVS